MRIGSERLREGGTGGGRRVAGARATGVTLSREGKKYCDYASRETGVPTEILLCDYRQTPLGQKFDKIASIEMAEHVGARPLALPALPSPVALRHHWGIW